MQPGGSVKDRVARAVGLLVSGRLAVDAVVATVLCDTGVKY